MLSSVIDGNEAGNRLLRLPGLASAHSHAFQRALRSRTHRRSNPSESFWSWRGLMFALAAQLDPDSIFELSRYAFVELAQSGVTAVGEFHYVHHAPGGQSYAQRTVMAERVIDAALAAGIRITLLRTVYLRAGFRQTLAPGQDRFVDRTLDEALADTLTLHTRYAGHPRVRIGIAPHSIGAVPIVQVAAIAQFARSHGLPCHMHISEQRRELDECRQEYATTPVALLAEHGILDGAFTGIHGTHMTAAEIAALGGSGAHLCICRTTERDLGDGQPDVAEMVDAGVPLCIGVDSHASSDHFEEMRAVELDERIRSERRVAALQATQLLKMGSHSGYRSIGWADAIGADQVLLRPDDPALAGFDPALPDDAVVFAGSPRAVEQVSVGDATIVEAGVHPLLAASRTAFVSRLQSWL
jgi:formiminoglutamate deiminase